LQYNNQKKSPCQLFLQARGLKNSQCYPLDKDRKPKDTQTIQTIQACNFTSD